MICPGDNILTKGWKLRRAITTVTIHEVITMGLEASALSAAAFALRTRHCGRTFDQNPSSKQARAGTIVNQFKNERLPLRMSVTWNKTITAPAMWRASR